MLVITPGQQVYMRLSGVTVREWSSCLWGLIQFHSSLTTSMDIPISQRKWLANVIWSLKKGEKGEKEKPKHIYKQKGLGVVNPLNCVVADPPTDTHTPPLHPLPLYFSGIMVRIPLDQPPSQQCSIHTFLFGQFCLPQNISYANPQYYNSIDWIN